MRRHRRRRHLIVTALLVSLCVTSAVPTAADDLGNQINSAKSHRNQITATMNQLKAEIARAQNREAVLQGVIDQLDIRITETQQAIAAAQIKLDAIKAALRAAQKHLAEVKATLAADKRSLATQMVNVYEMGNASTTLTNIFSAGDINDLVERVMAAQRIAQAEHTLTLRVDADAKEVSATVTTIAGQKVAQQAALSDLSDQQTNLQDQQEAERQARAYLAEVVAQDQIRLRAMQAARALLDRQIAKLEAEQAAAAAHGGGSGQFSWPLSGPITQGFGCTPYWFEPYDPNCASGHFHSGIDIAPGCYTPIHAADAGIVHEYYTGYGYGNYIIMVHGNGWSSVYGHMASFAVGGGVAVARGQLIGYEGSTGNSTGCHVHFEVRSNGVAVNPLRYLP